MDAHQEPASSIISSLGGATAVAARTGRDSSVVRRWRLPRPAGTGGVVPEDVRGALIEMAGELGVPLSYADFAPRSPNAETETADRHA